MDRVLEAIVKHSLRMGKQIRELELRDKDRDNHGGKNCPCQQAWWIREAWFDYTDLLNDEQFTVATDVFWTSRWGN